MVVIIGGGHALPIEQREIDHLMGVANHIRLLQAMHNKDAAAMLDRLAAGAQVEIGNHTAELENMNEGFVRTIRLALH